MNSAIYHIVFIVGSFTSTSAQWELDRVSAASGIMRRERQQVEITPHAIAHSAKDLVSDDSKPGEHVHHDGKKHFIRKAHSHSEAGAKAVSEHESKEAGKSPAHHKTHHHHKAHHHQRHHKHGHHHRHHKHEKVTDKKEAVAPSAAKEKMQTTHAEHSKDDKHGKNLKHAGKGPTAAHVESKPQGEKLQKGEKHGHDEKHVAHKASTHGDTKLAGKELKKESVHPLDKDAKHAPGIKDVQKGSSHKLEKGDTHGHDEKKVAKKAAAHGDTKIATNELPKTSEHRLGKDMKKPSTQEANKKSAAQGPSKAVTEDIAKKSATTADTPDEHDHRALADTSKAIKSSLSAADDANKESRDATEDKAALEEIAKEVESLHLTESEIDPDENFHAHKHEAFQVKVTGPSGHEMCLSEVHRGYQVRAVRCSGAYGQHWYWQDKQLKTLKSKERCLGYMSQTGQHRLAMYPCDEIEDAKSTTMAWKVDDTGRLRSLDTDRCMAFEPEEDKHLNAITLPCDEPEDAEEIHEEVVAAAK